MSPCVQIISPDDLLTFWAVGIAIGASLASLIEYVARNYRRERDTWNP